MRTKVESYLGFAVRARKIVFGYNQCEMAISRRKIKLLIVATDVAENTKKKFAKLAKEFNIPIYVYGKSEDISDICGNQMKNVFGVTDGHFASIIQNEIEKEKALEINETGGVLIDK